MLTPPRSARGRPLPGGPFGMSSRRHDAPARKASGSQIEGPNPQTARDETEPVSRQRYCVPAPALSRREGPSRPSRGVQCRGSPESHAYLQGPRAPSSPEFRGWRYRGLIYLDLHTVKGLGMDEIHPAELADGRLREDGSESPLTQDLNVLGHGITQERDQEQPFAPGAQEPCDRRIFPLGAHEIDHGRPQLKGCAPQPGKGKVLALQGARLVPGESAIRVHCSFPLL